MGTAYSPARYLMKRSLCMTFPMFCQKRVVLALDGDGNIGKPYTGCDGRNNLVPVPNGDAGSPNECLIWDDPGCKF